MNYRHNSAYCYSFRGGVGGFAHVCMLNVMCIGPTGWPEK